MVVVYKRTWLKEKCSRKQIWLKYSFLGIRLVKKSKIDEVEIIKEEFYYSNTDDILVDIRTSDKDYTGKLDDIILSHKFSFSGKGFKYFLATKSLTKLHRCLFLKYGRVYENFSWC